MLTGFLPASLADVYLLDPDFYFFYGGILFDITYINSKLLTGPVIPTFTRYLPALWLHSPCALDQTP